jgi:glycosyltransferase involved in cell wall biosynthesis
MKALVVSGIWPPDVGGPASHAPEVAGFLHERGHEVEVVTTASAAPAPVPYPIRWVRRSLPVGIRHVRGALLVRARAAAADVVYTTGMFGRSSLGSRLARTPYVLKLTADPAHERARRRGLSGGTLEEFQSDEAGLRVRALRAARDAELRGAAHIFCPSAYLRELVVGWGIAPERVEVLPNPLPDLPQLPAREGARSDLGLDGPTLVFAGRLTAQKSLGLALEALAQNPGVSLVLAGNGDEREELERRASDLGLDGRVRFLGPQPRERVLKLMRAGDALLLSSSWENFPHTVVESLAVGTPVLATAAGGVVEVVEDGRNGLLVQPGDADALAAAIGRFFADEGLREELRAAAAPSVARYAPGPIYARLEQALADAAANRTRN